MFEIQQQLSASHDRVFWYEGKFLNLWDNLGVDDDFQFPLRNLTDNIYPYMDMGIVTFDRNVVFVDWDNYCRSRSARLGLHHMTIVTDRSLRVDVSYSSWTTYVYGEDISTDQQLEFSVFSNFFCYSVPEFVDHPLAPIVRSVHFNNGWFGPNFFKWQARFGGSLVEMIGQHCGMLTAVPTARLEEKKYACLLAPVAMWILEASSMLRYRYFIMTSKQAPALNPQSN